MCRQAIAALVMMPITFTLASSVAQARNPARSTAVIDQRLREAVERKDVPGIVALVTDRKGVIYQGAFGVADVATDRPLTPDALFRIASMTKAITSAAAMQLVEQGKFALDDPVEKHLPELAKLPVFNSFDAKTGSYHLHPTSRPITVRHLLTHTSGLAIRSPARPCAISSRARARPIRSARCCSNRASNGSTAPTSTSSGASSSCSRGSRWKTISASDIFTPAGDERHVL